MHPINVLNAASRYLAGLAVVLLPVLLGASAAGATPDDGQAPRLGVEPAENTLPEVRGASYLRGWRVAVAHWANVAQSPAEASNAVAGPQPPPERSSYATEFDLAGDHVFVWSVAFGGDRWFALDTGRTSFPGWPCDSDCYARFSADPPPRVYAYDATGSRHADLTFEPRQHDAADYVRAIEYAAGKLYVLNANPPMVRTYTVDGTRLPNDDFYLAGGERHRTWDGQDRSNCCPEDFVYAGGRFHVLDTGTNRHAPKVFVYDAAGERIRAAEFQIDGLRYENCGTGGVCEAPTQIAYADGTFYVKVRVPNSAGRVVDVPVWLYSTDGNRMGTLYFDHSALFTYGMAYANNWLYLLSHINNVGLQRVCAYTTQGQRVASISAGPVGRFCETPPPAQGVAGG